MDALQFLQSVELVAGVDRDGARRAATATLATLAERLGREGADELAPALPGELREPLAGAPATAEAFDAEEFLRRTAARAGSSPARAGEYARAVLATLREDVAAVDRLRDRLPPDYQDLFL
jgi:uncharacterized protein (DUF2267 family)